VNHVAFRMPMLVLSISENLNKLLQDGRLAPITPLGELGRIMVMAVNVSVMFVVAILSAEYC
jgi:hypothetical protein